MKKILSIVSGALLCCLFTEASLALAKDSLPTAPVKPQTSVERVPVSNLSGYQGVTYERKSDGRIGSVIPGAVITFVKEDGSRTQSVTADSDGRYRITLLSGRYRVSATQRDFEEYSSAPGFFVVTGTSYQTGNIFMKKKRMTTILLTRHADRNDGADNLSAAGQARAEELVHVAEKAGVQAIFETQFVRSHQTVKPLADQLHLIPVKYDAYDYDGLKNKVFQHAGEVVFVAGHSDTLKPIIQAFGGDPEKLQFTGDEYDNLCVITVYGTGADKLTNVVNLQFGRKSP